MSHMPDCDHVMCEGEETCLRSPDPWGPGGKFVESGLEPVAEDDDPNED